MRLYFTFICPFPSLTRIAVRVLFIVSVILIDELIFIGCRQHSRFFFKKPGEVRHILKT